MNTNPKFALPPSLQVQWGPRLVTTARGHTRLTVGSQGRAFFFVFLELSRTEGGSPFLSLFFMACRVRAGHNDLSRTCFLQATVLTMLLTMLFRSLLPFRREQAICHSVQGLRNSVSMSGTPDIATHFRRANWWSPWGVSFVLCGYSYQTDFGPVFTNWEEICSGYALFYFNLAT